MNLPLSNEDNSRPCPCLTVDTPPVMFFINAHVTVAKGTLYGARQLCAAHVSEYLSSALIQYVRRSRPSIT